MTRRIRLGMVGGGEGAFIGAVHRIAARLDDQYELVAGALSSDSARAHASAAALHIEPGRSYASFEEMAGREAARPDRIDVVAIVTPNHLHFAPAQAFLGLYLVEGKRYGEAERAFEQSLALDRNCWPAHYGLTKLHLAAGNKEQAREHMKRLEALIEPDEYQILSKFNPPEPPGRSR